MPPDDNGQSTIDPEIIPPDEGGDEQQGPAGDDTGVRRRGEFGDETERALQLNAAYEVSAAMAQVQARYVVAARSPRNWDKVRQVMLKLCEIPSFAEMALWEKPQGRENISGLSVHFAREAMRVMKNLDSDSKIISDTATKRHVRNTLIDLESNTSHSTEMVMAKTVERSSESGRKALGTRINSSGRTTYILPATEDEMLGKQQSNVARAVRVNLLAFMPADIQEECEAMIRRVKKDKTAKDPDGARKQIIDGFGKVNVPVDELIDFVGHPLETCSPPELDELKGIWSAIKSGDAVWSEVLADRHGTREAKSKAAGGAGRIQAPQRGGRKAAAAVDRAVGAKPAMPAAAGTAPAASSSTPAPSKPTEDAPTGEPGKGAAANVEDQQFKDVAIFKLTSGQYSGRTLDQISREPGGLLYLADLVSRHGVSKSVSAPVEMFLSDPGVAADLAAAVAEKRS